MSPARRHNQDPHSAKAPEPTARERAERALLRGRGAHNWIVEPTQMRIETAAARLFAAQGVDGTTTREIARAAECSEGVIYRYWPSKDALARDLFNSVHLKLALFIRSTNATGTRIEEQVRAIVQIYCGLADADWDRFAFHLISTSYFVPTPEGDDNPVAAAEEIVRAAMARGQIPAGDPVVVAAMALGVLLQTALHKVYGRLDGRLSDHIDTIARAALAVLRSGEPA